MSQTSPPAERHAAARLDLKSMLPHEIHELVTEMGERPFRARQVRSWVHGRGVSDIDAMTDLSKEFRGALRDVACISRLHQVERQEAPGGGAVKFLFELCDGERVEAVLITGGKRRTACLSAQVGCAVGCTFCATARMGLRRQLSAGEIVDQLLQISEYAGQRGRRVSNVVMMGMGEPLLNYDAVLRGIRVMRLGLGPAIGGRKITVSTSGVVPGIHRLAREDVNVGLAISLNATTDAVREQLMPINRKYGIADLVAAAQDFYDIGRRRVTFEYVLLAGINDGVEDARRLAELSQRVPCKLNLIPYNELVADTPYRRPEDRQIERFRHMVSHGTAVPVTVRDSSGRDIHAACGQLCHQQDGDVSARGPGLPADWR